MKFHHCGKESDNKIPYQYQRSTCWLLVQASQPQDLFMALSADHGMVVQNGLALLLTALFGITTTCEWLIEPTCSTLILLNSTSCFSMLCSNCVSNSALLCSTGILLFSTSSPWYHHVFFCAIPFETTTRRSMVSTKTHNVWSRSGSCSSSPSASNNLKKDRCCLLCAVACLAFSSSLCIWPTLIHNLSEEDAIDSVI